MSTQPHAALLHTLCLFDAVRETPVPIDTLDPDTVEYGLEQGLCHQTPDNFIHLTALGLEQAHASRAAGMPLFGAGMDMTAHGLRLTTDLSAEDWIILMKRLQLVKSAYLNVLADAIAYGNARFTPEWVEDQITQMQFPFQDIEHANAIATVALTLRETHALTAEHYYILGLKFPTSPPNQDLWADRARIHNLSPLALRRSIESDAILTDQILSSKTGRDSGIVTIQGIGLNLSRWERQVGGLNTIKSWPSAQRQALLDELTPAHTLYETLRATLQA